MRRTKYEVRRINEWNELAYVCSAQAYPLRVAEREITLRGGVYLVMTIKTKEIKAYRYDGDKFTRTKIPEYIMPYIVKWIDIYAQLEHINLRCRR